MTTDRKPRIRTFLLAAAGLVPLLAALAMAAGWSPTRCLAAPNVAQAQPAAPAAGRVVAEGRVVTYPGAQVTVGTDLAGTLVRLAVTEQDVVRRGDVIAELRADDLRAELAEALARIDEAAADVRLADAEVERAERLHAEGVDTIQNADRARRNRDAAYARRATAEATVRRLEAVLDKTRIVAPIGGVVIARAAEQGESVASGAPLVTIADLSRVRIEAEVDEFDVPRVALGAAVRVTAEGAAGAGWRGTVEEIPSAVHGSRLKPQDPGRPSDTRVLLVKVALEEQTPLKLGQRVEVELGGR